MRHLETFLNQANALGISKVYDALGMGDNRERIAQVVITGTATIVLQGSLELFQE